MNKKTINFIVILQFSIIINYYNLNFENFAIIHAQIE